MGKVTVTRTSIEDLRKKFNTSARTERRGNIIRLGKNLDTKLVHFLTEPDGWLPYNECWIDGTRYFVTEENQAEFRGEKVKAKYLANVLDVENGESAILDMNPALANAVFNTIYEKKETIMGFDVEIFKQGSGMDTKYYASREDKVDLNYEQYELFDLDEALSGMMEASERYASNGGSKVDDYDTDDTDVETARKPTPKSRIKVSR